jgi:outer membrane protein assembly factor BamD
MPVVVKRFPRLTALTLLVVAAAFAAGCFGGKKAQMPAAGDRDADKYLFDRGTDSLQRKRWFEGREYFRKLVDTYPTSNYRQEAKLGIGDSYMGESRTDSYILAANEFREFLSYYPLNPRADYAQYRLALAQSRQVLGPQRDQTATRDALREFDAFIRNYPNSQYLAEAQKIQRTTRDRLSDSEFQVGQFYFRIRNYAGSIQRLKDLIAADPQYTHRDAAYYILAESYMRIQRLGDALPLYERIVKEFQSSEYLKAANARIAELNQK